MSAPNHDRCERRDGHARQARWRRRGPVICVLVLLTSCPAGESRAQVPAAARPGLASELDALMDAARADWNRGDLDGFVAPYHEAATFMTRRGPIGKREMRAAYEKNYFAGGKPRQQLAYEQLRTVPTGAETAVMTGRFVLSGGGEPEQSGWFTLVWVRTPAGWKILHDHSS